MTRRDFGKGLAAILAAGVAPSVIADGFRRGLAGRLAALSANSLPYDAQLQWISRGEAKRYVDTGITTATNPTVRFGVENSTMVESWFGAWQDTLWSHMGGLCAYPDNASRYNIFYQLCGNGGAVYLGPDFVGGHHDVVIGNKHFAIDGTDVAKYPTMTVQPVFYGSVLLLASRNGTVIQSRGSAGISYFQFEDNGDLLLDLIPVKIGGLGYFFDKISGTMYGNAADGNNGFPAACLGPEIA